MSQHGPGEELTQLMRDPAPRVRALAARLAGKLDLAFLRAELEALSGDADGRVRDDAGWALARMTPDGGRGGEIMARHGGYASLKAYQAAAILYDATVVFCNRFIDRRSRTHDQMVQAARSGKQNLAEGSAAAGTSSKTELKLTGVARASLVELCADYEDFLRQHGLRQWPKDDPQAVAIRKMAYVENRSYSFYRTYFESPASPEVAANAALCLVHQTTYLQDRLKKQQELAFIESGGISERMYQARMRYRQRSREE